MRYVTPLLLSLAIFFIYGCDSYTEYPSEPVSKVKGNWSSPIISLDSSVYYWNQITKEALLLDTSKQFNYLMQKLKADSVHFYCLMITIVENDRNITGSGTLAYHLMGNFHKERVEINGSFINDSDLVLNISGAYTFRGKLTYYKKYDVVIISGNISIESQEYYLYLYRGKKFWR